MPYENDMQITIWENKTIDILKYWFKNDKTLKNNQKTIENKLIQPLLDLICQYNMFDNSAFSLINNQENMTKYMVFNEKILGFFGKMKPYEKQYDILSTMVNEAESERLNDLSRIKQKYEKNDKSVIDSNIPKNGINVLSFDIDEFCKPYQPMPPNPFLGDGPATNDYNGPRIEEVD